MLVTDHEGRVFNIEMQTTDQDRSKQLHDGATKIIINSQKSAAGQSEDLQALAKLMNNEPVSTSIMHRKELKKSMKIQK